MNKQILFLFAILFTIGNSANSQQSLDGKLDVLDRYYSNSMEDWNTPGLAVAIVKDGEIIFSKGYGTRNIDTGEPVDANTLFAIASNSKAFTSAAIAMLIDEGLLDWDDKVRKYLPWFELYNPNVSDNMTIRDLLTHRSGLKTFSGDLIWYGTNLSAEEVVRNARYLEPAYGFREKYGYSNIMYLAAGLIIEEVSGLTWTEFITERILEPLEMNRTVCSTSDLPAMQNVSAPHNDYDEDIITIDWLNWDNIAPAGGLISSVNDISKWLIFQMNRGITKNGDTLINPERFREMWAAQTVQDVSSFSERFWPSTHFKAYGLGWSLMDYHGRKVISHGGGYDGFITNTTFIPEENIGYVILTNKNTLLFYPLAYKTFDVLLDVEDDRDWSSEFYELIERRDQQEEEMVREAEEKRLKDTEPTLPIDKYLGTYNCEFYGDAKVYMQEENMMIHLEPTEIFLGNLEHWQYNTWQVTMTKVPSLPKGLVNFTIGPDGKVDQMQIDIPNPDFYFDELIFRKLD
jgi:CubicO group peptidase (beta-lactamase class C family)